jgi:hypothetical protein
MAKSQRPVVMDKLSSSVLSVQLDQSNSLYFGVTYIFGNLLFRREYSIDHEF